jgi:hypothetical protein
MKIEKKKINFEEYEECWESDKSFMTKSFNCKKLLKTE